MSLLFFLFLVVMILALSNKKTLSFKTYGVAITLSTLTSSLHLPNTDHCNVRISPHHTGCSIDSWSRKSCQRL